LATAQSKEVRIIAEGSGFAKAPGGIFANFSRCFG